MTGIAVYTLLALGIGAWLPSLMLGTRQSAGAVLFGGYAAMTGMVFLLHVVLGMSLDATMWTAGVFAAAGLARLVLRHRTQYRNLIGHPAIVLPVAGALVIALRGGVDYLPYAVDEFTNWIGAAREIYLHGGYEAVRESIYLPAYTPGWRLTLLLPWQVTGSVAPGNSAAAPFVLHVGLVALLYDLVRCEIETRFPESAWAGAAGAWCVALAYLAAQGTGLLWTYVLLIEQPQIYLYTGAAFLLYAASQHAATRDVALAHAGIAVMGAYLMKSATVAILPGLLIGAVMLARQNRLPERSDVIRDALRYACLLAFPAVLAAGLWAHATPAGAEGCLATPLATLAPDSLNQALARDWGDLFVRYTTAIAQYVLGYKTPVLVAAVAGLGLAAFRGRAAAVVVLGVFALTYLAVLYWYHLSCFGDYYFERLNSIFRFTRVILQPLHALGLLALAIGVAGLIPAGKGKRFVESGFVRAGVVAVAVALGGWQVFLLDRTLLDISTRTVQSTDPRIAEVRRAALFIEENFRAGAPPPLVQFVSQGTDSDIIGYAKYFALAGTPGHPRALFRYGHQVSWSPEDPANIWQQKLGAPGVSALLKKADVIWPIVTDAWVDGLLLERVVNPADCAPPLTQHVLIAQAGGKFTCRRKP